MRPLSLILLAVLLGNCAPSQSLDQPGIINHVVLVWLKRPGNQTDRREILETAQTLRTIPGIRSLRSGLPLASERTVVDDSFDVGFVIQFDSAKALGEYGSHPTHQAARTKLRKLACKVVVYDIAQ